MKKLVSLFLIICILIGSVAFAFAENNITLPGGLAFGMSISEATSVSGYRRDTASDGPWYEMIKAYGFSDIDMLIGESMIGGLDAYVYAFFDDNKLVQIMYNIQFDNDEIEASAMESVASVSKSLSSKYGECLDKEYSKHLHSPHSSFDKSVGNDSQLISDSEIDTWLIKLDNGGSIYIDNYPVTLIYDNKYMLGVYYRHLLGYTYYDFQVDTTTPRSNGVDF